MLLSFYRCQLRHINHASINISTSIIGGRKGHVIWRIRWSPIRYWRSLQLMRCVMWRSGWLLTNREQLIWINDWMIQWRRHRYHQWWKIIDIWVTERATSCRYLWYMFLLHWIIQPSIHISCPRFVDSRPALHITLLVITSALIAISVTKRAMSWHHRWYLCFLHGMIQS